MGMRRRDVRATDEIKTLAMRPGQSNKRSRGRGRKGPSPLSRSHESNGPDVKIRGTAQHIADKYINLARDAQSSGDPVLSEAYFQHAEHYYRIVAAAQQQMNQPVNVKRADDPIDADEGEEREGFDPADPNAPQPDLQGATNGTGATREGPDGDDGDRRSRRGRGRSRRGRGDDPRRQAPREDGVSETLADGRDSSMADADSNGAGGQPDAATTTHADEAGDSAPSAPRAPRQRKSEVDVSDRFATDDVSDEAPKPQPVSFGDEVPPVQASTEEA